MTSLSAAAAVLGGAASHHEEGGGDAGGDLGEVLGTAHFLTLLEHFQSLPLPPLGDGGGSIPVDLEGAGGAEIGDLGSAPEGLRCAGADGVDPFQQVGAQRLAEGAQGALQHRRGGDNVGRVSPLELPEGEDHQLSGVRLPAQQLLERQMDVDADVDRVHGGLGMGAVASAALHPDDQVVTGGGDHAGAVAAQARWNHGDHVGTHGRIHMGIFQDAGLNHGSGP